MDQGSKVEGRGRDHMRYLQTGVVASDTHIKQKRVSLARFLRAWNRALKFYQDRPEVMLPYIQKRLGLKEAQLARRMYEDDAPYISRRAIEFGCNEGDRRDRQRSSKN
jgi:hypothetical protein